MCATKRTALNRYYAKHALPDSKVDKMKWMKEPATDEHLYSSDERIRNEISHEKERVIELSTSLALGNVQDAAKRAFRSVAMRAKQMTKALLQNRASMMQAVM